LPLLVVDQQTARDEEDLKRSGGGNGEGDGNADDGDGGNSEDDEGSGKSGDSSSDSVDDGGYDTGKEIAAKPKESDTDGQPLEAGRQKNDNLPPPALLQAAGNEAGGHGVENYRIRYTLLQCFLL
jgi:hypothetical protein